MRIIISHIRNRSFNSTSQGKLLLRRLHPPDVPLTRCRSQSKKKASIWVTSLVQTSGKRIERIPQACTAYFVQYGRGYAWTAMMSQHDGL